MNAFLLISSVFFVVTSNYYLHDIAQSKIFEFSNQSILNIFFVFIIYYFFKYTFSFSLKKYVNILALMFSLLFTIILQVGKTIYHTNSIINFFNNSILITVCQTFSFCIFFFASLRGLYHNICTNEQKKCLTFLYKIPNKYFNIITFLLIYISFFSAFFAYYPGILSYDSLKEFPLSNLYTRFDPPIYAFFLRNCHKLGIILNIEPIITFEIIQMTFLSYVMTRTICFLKTNLVNNFIIMSCLLFTVLNPSIAIFSIIPTKDAILACFFQLLIINIIQYFKNPMILRNNPFKQSVIISQIVICSLVRNNVIFAIVPTFLYILLNRYFKLSKLFFIGIIIYFFIQYPVYNYLHVKDGHIAESLAVPLNQISNVVVNDTNKLTVEEKEIINTFIPYKIIKKNFNLRYGDPIKDYFNEANFNFNKNLFLGTYFKLFFKFPIRYIDAFLNLCLPYWYFDASSIDKYSKRAFIETWIWNNTEYHFKRKSFSRTLLNYYENFANLKYIKKVPVLYFFFSLATPFFLILLSCFILASQKQYKGLVIIFLYMSLLGTYFLAPVSNFRYIFPFVCAYPIFVSFIFSSNKIFRSNNY